MASSLAKEIGNASTAGNNKAYSNRKCGKNEYSNCYELKPLELDQRTNSYIRVDTRELNRELLTK